MITSTIGEDFPSSMPTSMTEPFPGESSMTKLPGAGAVVGLGIAGFAISAIVSLGILGLAGYGIYRLAKGKRK